MRLSVVLLLSLLTVPVHAQEWGDVRTPAPGPARVLGGPASGCLAGAERLPSDGAGYQAVRVSRNRHWGHPATVAFVKDMGARARHAGLGDLYIGDLAQPRGGPMASLHGSHQNGLDVDIWFNLDPKPALPASARDDIAIVKLTTPDERSVDPALWRPEHARLLRMAADDPRVDRILVHFAIKKYLCETAGADRDWLRKIRPWRGHNEHFHVRLVCPAGSPDCVRQAAIPPGDGCDQTLAWWFLDAEERRRRDEEAARAAPRPQAGPPPRPKLPAQCAAILRAP